MKSTHFLVMLATLVFATAVFGNIANPDLPKNKSKSIDTTLSISLDRNAKEARLVIPRNQLKALRAELEQLDNGADAAAATSGGVGGTQTIVGGLFLSLAMVFGGVWLTRSGTIATKSGKSVAAAVVFFSMAAFATLVYANAGPPPEARSITGKMFSQAVHLYGFGSGKIKLEVSDTERYPTLIVPNPKTDTSTPGEE